jgi:isochorismate hydrolase
MFLQIEILYRTRNQLKLRGARAHACCIETYLDAWTSCPQRRYQKPKAAKVKSQH